MEYFVIIALILLNGLFSMSEIALVSVRRAGLAAEAEKGSRSAKAALGLSEQPDRFLSTVQIGITLIGILTGIYSGEVLSADFAGFLSSLGVPYPYRVAQAVIVVGVTYFTLVFGELVPKRLGLAFSNALAKLVAPLMNFLSVAAAPFVWLLSGSTRLIFRIFGLRDGRARVTEEEIRSMLREGTDGGDVREVEQDIVERVFTLGDRSVESIMTHRGDIVWLDISSGAGAVRARVAEAPFKVYPVGRGSLDDVAGLVSLRDILRTLDDPGFSLEKIVAPAHYFHEDMEVYMALGQMREKKIQCGFINDEFGALQGIVTLKDVLAALIGYAPDKSGGPAIVRRESGGWLVDGQCPFYDFLEHFGLERLYRDNPYNTLGGLVLDRLGHVPQAGERFRWEGMSFEVADMDGARIDMVIVKGPVPEAGA